MLVKSRRIVVETGSSSVLPPEYLVSTLTPATVLLCPLAPPPRAAPAAPRGLPIVPLNCGVGVDDSLPPAPVLGARLSPTNGCFPLEVFGEACPERAGAVKDGMADSSTSSSTSGWMNSGVPDALCRSAMLELD